MNTTRGLSAPPPSDNPLLLFLVAALVSVMIGALVAWLTYLVTPLVPVALLAGLGTTGPTFLAVLRLLK